MRILSVECATEACSVALFEDGHLLAHRHENIGRGHAERLVPMIGELPDKGQAQKILVSLGPGSFTGTRIGLAAARALGIAWKADLAGFPTLALVAATARQAEGFAHGELLVAMTGGHGEMFVQPFGADGLPLDEHRSLRPEIAAASFDTALVAGSRAKDLVDLRGSGSALDVLPDARFAWLVPERLLTKALSPIYGRPPDARLPA